MAEIQKFKCIQCNAEIIFDPNENIVASLNESFSFKKEKRKEDRVVTAYLTCPNKHTNPYRVTKTYEI